MKKITILATGMIFLLITAMPVFADDSGLVSQIDKILSKGPDNDNYHITALQLDKWMKSGKTDFQVIDVRIPPGDGEWGMPEFGRIPGSIHIPYTELFRPENLKKLPKNKKLILVGNMSVYENYLIVPLRLIGHDAYILLMGMSGWQKDYPAVGHVSMLINAPKKMDFPLEKETDSKSIHHKHKGH